MSEPHYRFVKASIEQEVLVLTITEAQIEGEDIATVLRDEMLQALAASGKHKVAIDFQHTKYISSVAFRPLLTLRRKVQESSGRIMVCGLSPVIGDVFYTTRMVNSSGSFTAPFEIEADVQAAVVRLNQPPEQPKEAP